MRRLFRFRNLLVKAAVCTLAVSLSACRQQKTDAISLGEWILVLSERAGIRDYSQTAPYFMNITETSPYYSAVQACVEWKVLEPGAGFEPADPLTREWAAYTLVNLSGNEFGNNHALKDRGRSRFPDHIEYAASSGLIRPVRKDIFNPEGLMDRQTAMELLEQVVRYIDHRNFEDSVQEIEWKDDFDLIEEQPSEFDEDNMTAVYPADTPVKQNDILSFNDSSGEKVYWKVRSIAGNGEEITADCCVPEPEDYAESIDVQSSFDVDFRTAEITDLSDGFVLQQESSYAETGNVSFMSAHPLSRTRTYNGYTVSYSAGASGIRASVCRKTAHGLEMSADVSLTGVHPSYSWKMENGNVKYGYFRVDFRTTETLLSKVGSYRKFFGDFRKIDPDSFISSLRNVFSPQETAAETIIPLAQIRVPVPNAPLLDLVMQIQIRVSASGRAQLTLTQDHSIGMEIRDGRMRAIHDNDHKSQTMIRSDVSVMSGIKTALNMAQMALADITVEAGAKANTASTVHFYDGDSHRSETLSDLPADYVDEMAEETDDVLVCTDIKAYWTADAVLNSRGTAAARLGFTRSISILNETNGKLIPGMKTHMENWQFVDRCTRGNRLKQKQTEIVDSDTIRISAYSVILSPAESIGVRVTGLPKGYTLDDLVFSALDPGIVKISGNTVYALNEGSTIVYVRTADGKYEVGLSVIIREDN